MPLSLSHIGSLLETEGGNSRWVVLLCSQPELGAWDYHIKDTPTHSTHAKHTWIKYSLGDGNGPVSGKKKKKLPKKSIRSSIRQTTATTLYYLTPFQSSECFVTDDEGMHFS